jgi:hypothetical protein
MLCGFALMRSAASTTVSSSGSCRSALDAHSRSSMTRATSSSSASRASEGEKFRPPKRPTGLRPYPRRRAFDSSGVHQSPSLMRAPGALARERVASGFAPDGLLGNRGSPAYWV